MKSFNGLMRTLHRLWIRQICGLVGRWLDSVVDLDLGPALLTHHAPVHNASTAGSHLTSYTTQTVCSSPISRPRTTELEHVFSASI